MSSVFYCSTGFFAVPFFFYLVIESQDQVHIRWPQTHLGPPNVCLDLSSTRKVRLLTWHTASVGELAIISPTALRHSPGPWSYPLPAAIGTLPVPRVTRYLPRIALSRSLELPVTYRASALSQSLELPVTCRASALSRSLELPVFRKFCTLYDCLYLQF